MTEPVAAFAVVAIVLTVSALASVLVERLPISFAVIFLGLGFALGPRGVGLIEIGLHDEILQVVATLTLALVLFLDAVRIQIDELRTHRALPVLILGPGTLLIIAAGAGAALLLFGLPPAGALLIGAALASTDPVVLRDIVRDERIPRSIRQVLKLEAGLNDLVVLPIILIVIAAATARAADPAAWALLLLKILLVGPLIGFAIGGAGSWLIARLDARFSVRREIQALYGVGLVLAAHSSAAAAGGDGFLAAFAAGLAIPLLNRSLCDCFLEYGEVTSEMAMLLSFILFGAVLSTSLTSFALAPALLLAALLIVLVRPVVLSLVLARAHISGPARALVAWFGPRGLNSLLLALLVVLAGVPDGERIFSIVGVVVLVSALAHGISASQLRRRLAEADPPLVLDVRSRSDFETGGDGIPGEVRVPPDQVVESGAGRPRTRSIVTYCT